MRKISVLAAFVLGISGGAFAQGDRVFDLPMLTQAPVLDGVIDGDEWAESLGLECSPSLIQADGAEFGSLAGFITLFSVPELVLVGWIHYLAFDLFVGAWEVKDAQKEGIHHLVLIPSLLATLMAGPVRLVLFWVVKLSYRAARSPAAGEV